MRTPQMIVVGGLLVILLLQLVRPRIPTGSAIDEVQVPPRVRRILSKDCYSCHSNQRRLAWFDEIEPAYWLVRQDILTAREHLNFQTLGSKPPAMQKGALYEAVNMIELGAMPLARYVALHPQAKVTQEEVSVLKTYLGPWRQAPMQADHPATVSTGSTDLLQPADLASVPAEFNGLKFDKDFERWKPISFTDRGDNNTFRFILGNEIAVKAARSGDISPWPNGTRFAKIAWQQEKGFDGLIHPGKFVQVEFMVKDTRLYRQTAGWGWGRWRGLDLKPYGQDAGFVGECMSCHSPLRGADDVYTLPISKAHASRQETVNNRAAGLPLALPYEPMTWGAITMFVDPVCRTMATLFGNKAALGGTPARVIGAVKRNYSAGAVLALVTWSQREDPHWFGARIPDTPQSVEFVEVNAEGEAKNYRRFEGTGLTERRVPGSIAARRIKLVLHLAPARLP